jgi:hypothetical protein
MHERVADRREFDLSEADIQLSQKQTSRSRHPTFAEPSADEPIRQPAFSEINPNQLIRAFDSRRH